MVHAETLKPLEVNPRVHDDAAAEHLKESIRRFGLVDPLIVNCAHGRENVIIGGHFRWKVARQMGIKEVPVVFVRIPDIEKEQELALRLNRNTGSWDFDLLREFDTDFLLDVGFDDGDLSHIWDDALETEDDGFDAEKELEQITEPVTKPGDLYRLGSHRLLCADATDPKSTRVLLGEERTGMIYCDPPYNINLSYDRGIGNTARYGGTTDDNLTEEQYRAFLSQTIINALAVAAEHCHVFYWCDQKYIGLLQDLYRQHDIDFKRVALWIKNAANVTPQVAFNKCYEPIVYGVRGSPYLSPSQRSTTEIQNKEIGSGNRSIDDILDLLDIWLCKRLSGTEYEHPTQKPPTLHEKALRRCTKVGDAVLDLFGGSGSTLIACEQLKRRCFLVEKEPVFCDLIVRRFEMLTGMTTTRIRS